MKTKRNLFISFILAVSVILAGAVIASAQEMTPIKPPTASKQGRRNSGRSRTPKKAPMCDTMTEPNTTMAPGAGQDNPMDGGKDEDLSGTYHGTVAYPDGNLNGTATLTITGKEFTLAIEGGETVTGRISAVNTRGYIGATLRFGDRTESDKVASTPIPQVSVRARKMGMNLSLMSVPEDTRKFSFVPGKMTKKEKMAMCGPM